MVRPWSLKEKERPKQGEEDRDGKKKKKKNKELSHLDHLNKCAYTHTPAHTHSKKKNAATKTHIVVFQLMCCV